MKLTFTSIDLRAAVTELQKSIVGFRVNQIYDVDHKTYLFKLQKPEHKMVLLVESGARMHTTDYQWPKNPAPSGFSMKLRKHLRNKRVESVRQLGVDRVAVLQFGIGDAEHHLVIELYDRGNIILTDAAFTILSILRPRTDGEDIRLAAYEVYPIETFRIVRAPPSLEDIKESIQQAKPTTTIKKILNPMLDSGGGAVEHQLTTAGLCAGITAAAVAVDDVKLAAVHTAAAAAQRLMTEDMPSNGYIIQRKEEKSSLSGSAGETLLLHQEFHPMLYAQHTTLPHLHYPSFNQACDEFFQQLESQRLEQRAAQQQRDALKKLDNVRSDHSNRLAALRRLQDQDTIKGQLIELNQSLVETAIGQVRAAVADQLDWRQIEELLAEAQERGDAIALAIKSLSLKTNTVTMILSDPYDQEEDDLLLDSDEEREDDRQSDKLRPSTVSIDLDLTAHANARRYYDNRRKAVTKVEKTMAASAAALKSATRKTKQTLRDVHTATCINKMRKVHWFEKFLWFISSENYLVLAGHDQQQNEQLVKRHLKPHDAYIHADLHGAASVVVKNSSGAAMPPATLLQAGAMALCYSRAWAEKVVTSAWWVWGHQVSKTAPTGEYLTTGAFMVRGKKNFLPPSHLVYGFGFLFRLEESSIQRHGGDRRVKSMEEGFDPRYGRTHVAESFDQLALDDVKEEEPVQGMKEAQEKQEEQEKEQEDEEELQLSEEEQDGEDESKCEDGKEERRNEEEDKSALDEHCEEHEGDGAVAGVAEEAVVEFPDTVVEMKHVHGDTFAVSATTEPTHERVAAAAAAGHSKRGGEGKSKGNKNKLSQNTENEQEKYSKVDGSEIDPSQCSSTNETFTQFTNDGSTQATNRHKSTRGDSKTECSVSDKQSNKAESERGTQKGAEEPPTGTAPLKRGQAARLKKMKTKYKHQDEEERSLMMQLLQSDGTKKESKRVKGKKAQKALKLQQKQQQLLQQKNFKNLQRKIDEDLDETAKETGNEGDKEGDKDNQEPEDDEEEEDTVQLGDDLAILNELTGQPVAEDELLYCVPVCAPYTALANYKYKVKLTPGPGKKGRACKMAVSLFLSMKPPNTREGDLLRAVRDSDLARNVPGKVKVSAPNITKIRK